MKKKMKKYLVIIISFIYIAFIIYLVKIGNINFVKSFWLLLYGMIVIYIATIPEKSKEKILQNTIKELQNHIKKLNKKLLYNEEKIKNMKLSLYIMRGTLKNIKEILEQNDYNSNENTINKIRELIHSSKID